MDMQAKHSHPAQGVHAEHSVGWMRMLRFHIHLRDSAFVAHRLTLGCHGLDQVRSGRTLEREPVTNSRTIRSFNGCMKWTRVLRRVTSGFSR